MADGLQSALAAAENLELTLDQALKKFTYLAGPHPPSARSDCKAIALYLSCIQSDPCKLDDKEFDLPSVEKPPTLESILNEPDEDVFPEEDLAPPLLLQGDQGSDTASMSSQEGVLEGKTRRKHKKSIRYEQHGSILRHVVLKGVSSQIVSAADRVDAGMPTALAVASMIAIGTSHGLVLVFVKVPMKPRDASDPKQVLNWCLGSTAVGAEYGAVSALSFNCDCTRLLSGFAKGQITMWDLTNGKLLRTITDAHPPGTAILHVKFTDDPTLAVCSDSGGSVFELEMKRLIGVRTCESRCLFSGSRGEACTIEPLHMNHMVEDHPMRNVSILAMASLSKVLIVTLRPTLRVMFTHPLKGDAATLPLLAWQFVIIQVSEKDRVIDPVLAFARDQTIHFFQVVCHTPDDIRFTALQKTELPYKLLNLVWMNSRTMVAIDTSERAHIIDVRSEEELEVVDLGNVQMVYSTSFYKSLATGGNVSKALAYAGERACYQSMVSFNSQLVLLGTKSVHVMTMRNWGERIDVLVRQTKYREALALAQSFYEGKAKAVVGLSGSLSRRKLIAGEKMLELLDIFVDVSMTSNCPSYGKVAELEEYYQNIVPVCVDFCLTLDRTDILFGKIYEQFSSDPLAQGMFLECLEPYILNDQLGSITPSVMKDFVDHYQNKGLLQNVEACIVHLDISSLDIHQVVVLCWANGLYDAILYIYNRGMLDYVTPLEELLIVLRSAVNTGKQLTDEQIKLGNKLLVYISCCLAGRAYPLGDIPTDLVPRVKEEVFKSLTCLHSRDADPEEPVYPHLKTLLQFDTREFFNVLALAFEEEEFNSEEGMQRRQRVVDILLQIMVESVGFSPTQVGILFTFLARQMARHENAIMVSRVLFEQVLEFLTVDSGTDNDSKHEERQQALLELLNAGGLQHFDEERLINLAEKAKFYRVCELMYEKRREFNKILSCYWRDSARQHHSFSYIEQIMMDTQYNLDEKQAVQLEAMKHIKELVEIDSKKTAQLVLLSFSNSLTDVVKQLRDNEKTLYCFLQGVFEYRESSGSAIYNERQFNVEAEIHELYIELMCKHQSSAVQPYLKSADGYRLEETLEICRRYHVMDATAYLLEKAGDVQGAFNIILEDLQKKIRELVRLVEEEKEAGSCPDLPVAWSSAETTLLVIIQLCQRNSGKMDEAQRESLWFPLFEAMMSPQRKLKDTVTKENIEAFKGLTRHVLNSMMGYIALPAILQKIMQDPAYNTGKFGEVKELILGMLETYNYEKTLLHTCNNLLNHDIYVNLASLTTAASRGIISRSDVCHLCSKNFMDRSDYQSVICFRCGHGYHTSCLKSTGSVHFVEGEEIWVCYICNSAKRGRIPSSSRMQRQISSIGGTSSSGPSKSSKAGKKGEVLLEPEQIQAMENLRRIQKSPSRMAILAELSKPESRSKFKTSTNSSSILQNEQFQLRLAAPPVTELSHD